jgi:ubiquinone/menaquinone biosynthesis C-methylase UbiE
MASQMKTTIPTRVPRTKQQARNYYSAISRFYDLLSGGAEERLRNDAIRRLGIRPGEKILEIGTGTGGGLMSMAHAAGPSGGAVGIDLAEGMLALARKRQRGSGIADRIALASADGSRLSFRSDVFDAVFMSFTLELFDTPEIPIVLAQCRRVLKTDGRLGIVGMALAPDPNWMSKLYGAMHAAFPVWVDCRPIDSRSQVEAAGFTVVDASRESVFSLPVVILVARKS